MNKKVIIGIIIAIVVVAAVVLGVVLMGGGNKVKSNLNIQSAQDLEALVTNMYTGLEDKLPISLATTTLDLSDTETFTYVTGLSSTEGIEYAVMSEPMMSSQAYSLLLVKVAEGTDANQIAKTMSESVDMRKWICVTAEKLYATNSGNVVCLVMTNAESAKLVYDNFKALAGEVGQEYEKTEAI